MSIDTILSVLSARLAAIAPVRRSREALETTSAQLPCIVMLSQSDDFAREQDYSAYPARTRALVLEYKMQAGDDYEAELYAAQLTMAACVHPDADGSWLGGNALGARDQGARFIHPQPGSNVAAIQVQVEIDYI